MQKHTKIYLKSMGYDQSDFIQCEIIGCEVAVIDVHHIDCKGMGGSKTKDYIENLQGLCRHHHERYGDKKDYTDWLRYCHIKAMQERNVSFNNELIQTDYEKSI